MADRSTAMKGNQNARKNGSKISAFVGIAKATPHAIMHGVAQATKPAYVKGKGIIEKLDDISKKMLYGDKKYTDLTDTDKLKMTKGLKGVMIGATTVNVMDNQMKAIKDIRDPKVRAKMSPRLLKKYDAFASKWQAKNGKVK